MAESFFELLHSNPELLRNPPDIDFQPTPDRSELFRRLRTGVNLIEPFVRAEIGNSHNFHTDVLMRGLEGYKNTRGIRLGRTDEHQRIIPATGGAGELHLRVLEPTEGHMFYTWNLGFYRDPEAKGETTELDRVVDCEVAALAVKTLGVLLHLEGSEVAKNVIVLPPFDQLGI